MVTVAVVEGCFLLFMKILIYHHAQQYTLFEIFSLPGATDNGTHRVVIYPIFWSFLQTWKRSLHSPQKMGTINL
jgi:hypothetical protein